MVHPNNTSEDIECSRKDSASGGDTLVSPIIPLDMSFPNLEVDLPPLCSPLSSGTVRKSTSKFMPDVVMPLKSHFNYPMFDGVKPLKRRGLNETTVHTPITLNSSSEEDFVVGDKKKPGKCSI